ncbi:hypothetical protein Q9L58_002003 [Maublancomyces gigas]|uniref:Uncharacterized protein n=1 Tax=Discina gigas TaxID=1032678 RepID=A0ABR3GTB6_9PEZI
MCDNTSSDDGMEYGDCWLDQYIRPGGTLGRIDHWKSVHLDAIKTKLIELKWDGSIKKHKDKSSAMLEVFFNLARMTADKTEVGTQFKGKLQRKIRSIGKEISETVVERVGVSQGGDFELVFVDLVMPHSYKAHRGNKDGRYLDVTR